VTSRATGSTTTRLSVPQAPSVHRTPAPIVNCPVPAISTLLALGNRAHRHDETLLPVPASQPRGGARTAANDAGGGSGRWSYPHQAATGPQAAAADAWQTALAVPS